MIQLLKLRPYSGDIAPPSPNHGARKAKAIEGIVLHATEDAGNEARALSWLCSPESRTSYHLLVTRDGRVVRLVGDQQRAWHAGLSSWRGKRDVNSITLGIAIANRNDGEPYTAAQYRRVSEIVAHYCRQGLSPDDVISHAEIAPGRRTDPLGWDWHRLRAMVNHQLQPVDFPPPGTTPGQRAVPPVPPPPTPPAAAPPTAQPGVQWLPGIFRPKPMVRSRTLWLNGLMVLAAAGAIVIDTLHLAPVFGLDLPDTVVIWLLFGVALVNIVLRFSTTQPLRPAAARSSSRGVGASLTG